MGYNILVNPTKVERKTVARKIIENLSSYTMHTYIHVGTFQKLGVYAGMMNAQYGDLNHNLTGNVGIYIISPCEMEHEHVCQEHVLNLSLSKSLR